MKHIIKTFLKYGIFNIVCVSTICYFEIKNINKKK